MKRKILLILLLAVIVIAIGYIYSYEKKKEEEDHLTLYGNVDVRLVDLGFRVSGKVDKMFYQEGDIVKAGEILGILDNQPYSDQLTQSAATSASIKSTMENSEAQLKRRKELIQDGSISQEELDNIQSNYDVQVANLLQAEAALAVAKNNLEYIKVYAPTDGTILTRVKEPGTVVNIGDPIYTISISDPVWIRAFVPEPHLGLIYPGMEAQVYTDTPGGKIYTGRIGFISPVAEFTPKSVETTELRTDLVYRLRIYVDHPDKGLRQGMPVTIKIDRKKKEHPDER